ncbi:hypothetical protein [Vaginisenegalia massiliensis]|nr:hypothetical protein [Vaginisenegalia massiliensis]
MSVDDWFSYYAYFIGIDPQTVWETDLEDLARIADNKVAIENFINAD